MPAAALGSAGPALGAGLGAGSWGRAWGGAGVVQALCRAAGEVVDATLKATNKDPEDDPPLDIVAGLYCDRTAGDHSARSAVRSRQGRRGASRLRLTRPLAG